MSIYNERMDGEVLSRIEPGAAAVTSDGKKVGTVAGVDGRYIKVNVPLKPDFWLKPDDVVDCEPGVVRLGFLKKDLGGYRIDKPEVAPGSVLEEEDHIVSTEGQLEQRARMERELDDRRRRRSA